jgi:hypothetical protein
MRLLVDFLNKYSYTKVHLDMTSNQVLSDIRGEHILLQQLIIIRLNEQKYIPVPVLLITATCRLDSCCVHLSKALYLAHVDSLFNSKT